MGKTKKIIVEDTEISVILQHGADDFICLTDMAKYKDNDPAFIIGHWLRLRNTIEYMGTWETLHNPHFKPTEFGRFLSESGANSFTMSPKKWIEATDAIGIYSKSGRNGGTYAHKDIAFNFGMWLSPTFQLYVVKEYQRLVEVENSPLSIQWSARRFLSKANYTIHTDAIKKQLSNFGYSKAKQILVYAQEADMLNIIVFGCTAKEWEQANSDLAKKGMNIRDTASIAQLLILSNLEVINSDLVRKNISRHERIKILVEMAKNQMETLDKSNIEHRFRKQFPENEVGKLLE